MSNLSRRKFIITAGATAAGTLLAHGCSSGSTTSNGGATPAGGGSPSAAPAVNINPADAPEVTAAKLGFIALTDAAPLIVAQEKGLFAKYGMKDVQVIQQPSWPVTRDNIELGSDKGGIDGAHILSPMPYQMTLGTITKGGQPMPMNIVARLNTNGQAISLSQKYLDLKVGTDSKVLKAALANQKVAITFPGGTHDLWMRYWLAAGGINPDTDVSVNPVPPPQMVANMKVGSMEAFCVGEPWNAQLVTQKVGYTALVTGELWKDHPEKALALRADWVEKNPKATKAITMAVLEAQQWCDQPENKDEMCQIISQDQWLAVAVPDIIGRSKGQIDYGTDRIEAASPVAMKFWADNASYPYKSHDTWFIMENIRWGYMKPDTDIKGTVDKVNREDIWKAAATALGVPAAQIPATTSRGVETFFDGVKFDPDKPQEYLNGLAIKKA